MPHGLPCINPVCDYEFAHEQIKGASSLKCPKCGNVFQFSTQEIARETSKPTSATKPPAAKPVSKPPAAKPVSSTKPIAAPPAAKPVKAPVAKSDGKLDAIPVAKQAPAAKPVAPGQPNKAIPQPVKVDVELAKPNTTAPTNNTIPDAGPPVAKRVAPPSPFDNATANQVVGGEAAFPEGNHFGTGGLVATSALERRRQPTRPLWINIVLGLSLAAIVCSFLAFLVIPKSWYMGDGLAPIPSDAYTMNGFIFRKGGSEKEKAFQLVLPEDVWDTNTTYRNRLNAVVALERQVAVEGYEQPVLVWLAFAGVDYGQQKPREAELLERMLQRLERCFGKNLEVAQTPELREFAKTTAQVLEFRGEINNVFWAGEAWTFTHHGFGYWMFTAAPELAIAKAVLKDFQSGKGMGFRFADNRRGWTEQPPPLNTFASTDGTFQIRGVEGVWKKLGKATDLDEFGLLYLNGRDLQDLKNNVKGAHVLVLKLEKQAKDLQDAMQQGVDYVEATFKSINEKYALVPTADSPENKLGTVEKLGNQIGRIAEFKVTRGDESPTYVMIGAFKTDDAIYVIQCNAVWDYHAIWRNDFLDLMRTTKLN